ncbi:NmrA/HSCARG family protein [Leifsonia sp. McL0607]|uniref:NmrA/HSCARG family protein n=1 Tax=Leifsonia sp. McL0607 TaxID=3415672 RepID=UPI003CFBA522
MSDLIAVVGATGKQGGAVVNALLERGAPVRALTRDAGSDRALALAERGVEVVVADVDDPVATRAALDDVSALSLMTTFAGADGPRGETRRGITLVEAARDAGVPFVVQSSVGGAERETGIPHFESKRRVEEALEASGVAHAFVRPVFFMENLAYQLPASGADKAVVRMPMPGTVPLQLVAVVDIGRVVAALVTDPEGAAGTAVEIAGDELTFEQIVAQISAATGVPTRFAELPVDALDDDRGSMFRWFSTLPAYQADFAATKALDPQVLSFADWLVAGR